MEVQGINAYAKAEKFTATNWASAKRAASRRQSFYGTVLYLGIARDSNGFVDKDHEYAYKDEDGWHDCFLD